jgi:hypothetical protein
MDAEIAFPAGHFRGIVEGVVRAVGEVGRAQPPAVSARSTCPALRRSGRKGNVHLPNFTFLHRPALRAPAARPVPGLPRWPDPRRRIPPVTPGGTSIGPLTRTSTNAPSGSGAFGTTTPFLTKPATVTDITWPSGITSKDCNRPASSCHRDARGCPAQAIANSTSARNSGSSGSSASLSASAFRRLFHLTPSSARLYNRPRLQRPGNGCGLGTLPLRASARR